MSLNTIYDTAYRGDFNQIKVRVDQSKDIITEPDQDGRLLIHWAALSGNNHLVEFLIDSQSPVDPLDETNVTPLILAASANRYDVVRLLLGRGADIDKKTNRGQSALHYACSKGYKEVAQLLLEAGADINTADVLRATPLHRAASQGRTSVVELLLANSDAPCVDACDSTGCTPLHLACEEDRETVALLLVKAGADINAANRENKTPLDLSSLKLKKRLMATES